MKTLAFLQRALPLRLCSDEELYRRASASAYSRFIHESNGALPESAAKRRALLPTYRPFSDEMIRRKRLGAA